MDGERSTVSLEIDPASSPVPIGSAKRENQTGTTCAEKQTAAAPASPDTSVTTGSSSTDTNSRSTTPMQCLHQSRQFAQNSAASAQQQTSPKTSGIQIPKSIDEYRTLLRRNATVVQLAEDVLSRLILYAPSRLAHADDEHTPGVSLGAALLNAESLYALLNLWQLTNDVVLHGPGDGTGMTIGTADEATAAFVGGDNKHTESDNMLLREDLGEVSTFDPYASDLSPSSVLAKVLPQCVKDAVSDPTRLILGLRTVLSVVEYVAPAMEVLSGIPSRQAGSIAGPIHVQRQRRAEAELRKMNTLTRLERIKFYCRLCLLVANATNAYRRIQNDDEVDGQSVVCASIFRHGGMLHPGERAVPSALEEERLRRVGYVGRRTGRRIYPGGTPSKSPMAPRRHNPTNGTTGGDGWVNLSNASATTKLVALAAGELLHIYRPLYWTASERGHAAHSLHMQQMGGLSNTRPSSERVAMLKSWIIGLAMDVLSHRLTLAASGSSSADNIPFRGQTENSNINLPPATAEELKRRKLRWMLYLLRCPVWDVLTRPVAGGLADIVSRFVPLLGRPLATYVMDLLVYWQRHHFMLEG